VKLATIVTPDAPDLQKVHKSIWTTSTTIKISEFHSFHRFLLRN